MSVSNSINGALLRFGRPMTLRRNSWAGAVNTPTDVTVYAVFDDYKPQDLVNGIIQGDSIAKFSNKQIAAASWPGPPAVGDTIIGDGRSRDILAVDPKYLGTEILAYFCQTRG